MLAFFVVMAIGIGDSNLRALIIAGSNGFTNYRHQADVCHQYHLFTSVIETLDVTLMMYDDVAWSHRNPLIGRLFNRPNGTNVYDGCVTDYRKEQVSLDNFVGEIGRLAGSIQSNSTSFISFVDHGQPGYLLLPNGERLDAETLMHSLVTLSDASPSSMILVYVEACHAGSLFEGREIPPRTLIVTAANATESSWAAYCPTPKHPLADVINGVHIGACLGDLFSVTWVNDIETRLRNGESPTLRTHIEAVKSVVSKKSNVMVYGDMSLLDVNLFEIFRPFKNWSSHDVSEGIDQTVMIESAQPQLCPESIKNIPETVNTEVIM